MTGKKCKMFTIEVILKYLIDQTTPRSSSSFTLHRSPQRFKNRDVKVIGCHASTVNCSSPAPRPERDASHFTRVSRCGLE